MVRPRRGFTERMPIRDVDIGKRYEGTVERLTNYGAYVDIDAERLAFLHVAAIWGRRSRETLEKVRIGGRFWVNVDDVDEIGPHIRLKARGRHHTESQKDGPLGELARREGDEQADGQQVGRLSSGGGVREMKRKIRMVQMKRAIRMKPLRIYMNERLKMTCARTWSCCQKISPT